MQEKLKKFDKFLHAMPSKPRMGASAKEAPSSNTDGSDNSTDAKVLRGKIEGAYSKPNSIPSNWITRVRTH